MEWNNPCKEINKSKIIIKSFTHKETLEIDKRISEKNDKFKKYIINRNNFK